MSDDRYVFIVEWYDSAASLVRNYNFTYYLKDSSIEMVPRKKFSSTERQEKYFSKDVSILLCNSKTFFEGPLLMFIQGSLKELILQISSPGTNLKTKKESKLFINHRTFAMIKPDAYLNIGKIINMIEEDGFTISNIKMTKFTEQDAQQFYAEHKGKPFFNTLVQFMSSDLIVGLELVAENSVAKWRKLLGPTNSLQAKSESPNSIRGLFGTDGTKNAAHGSDSFTSAARELDFFFSSKSPLKTTAYLNNCTCLVIKPHLITDRYVGQVIDIVLNSGFEISALQMFWLDKPSAEEFLEVYKTVVNDYNLIIEELTNGPCIALEVRQDNPVPLLRELCGPSDPNLARTVRPRTIRAVYGKDNVKNGVHCTDLVEDGVLEAEYFFSILQK